MVSVFINYLSLPNYSLSELRHLPYEWEKEWGTFDEKSGTLTHNGADKTNNVTVTVSGNPLTKSSSTKNMEIENNDNNNTTIFELLNDDDV